MVCFQFIFKKTVYTLILRSVFLNVPSFIFVLNFYGLSYHFLRKYNIFVTACLWYNTVIK